MPPESPKPPQETGLVNQPPAGLVTMPDGRSPALSEMIGRSLVHLQTSQASAVPERRAGEECDFEIAPRVMMRMCWIPPGEFVMGSPPDELGRHWDETQHAVTISQGFWLGKYEVTQAQWEAVTGTNPSHIKEPKLPVDGVSWNRISGPGGFLEKANFFAAPGERFSLPTEAQWEYACRAGTVTAFNTGKNLTYTEGNCPYLEEGDPYYEETGGKLHLRFVDASGLREIPGNMHDRRAACPNLDEVGWYSKNSGGGIHPGGLKTANAWGLHDMHGNLLEWCADLYDDYLLDVGKDFDPEEEFLRARSNRGARVRRGGSWISGAHLCRAAARASERPHSGYFCIDLGFRVARSSVP